MLPVAIIIPIYKDEMTSYEMISLQQCFAVLNNYPIIFVCPKSMEFGFFHQERKDIAEFVFLNNNNFESIITYNHMLLSVWFYELFINYKYVLIHQLDCFVFKDELTLWVEKGYSYIGAPWFLGNSNNDCVDELVGVGNGGFSLRKVKDCIAVLKSRRKTNCLKNYILQNKQAAKSFYLLRGIKQYAKSDSFKTIHKNELVNEDKIFSLAGKRFDFFIIPDTKTATMFAFETQPKKLFKFNNYQLPFGCHAWWKYDFEFYIPFFKKQGYQFE